ncbi:MAG: DUF4870 domain-containing protein [Acidobacteria bacterium]|nr:DUF4870 domain-containing protein [Acidobacteriota bacterium]MBI3281481.1 DUF4870 domain-containing protein [Acidobacteriota bacterium]
MTENVAGALCYLLGFITGILFLVLEPHNRNPFVRFHAFQSIFFNIAWFVFWIAFSIVEMIIFTVLPSLIGLLTSLLSLVIGLGGIALWVFLMYKAYNHERFKLPLVGDLAEKQA